MLPNARGITGRFLFPVRGRTTATAKCVGDTSIWRTRSERVNALTGRRQHSALWRTQRGAVPGHGLIARRVAACNTYYAGHAHARCAFLRRSAVPTEGWNGTEPNNGRMTVAGTPARAAWMATAFLLATTAQAADWAGMRSSFCRSPAAPARMPGCCPAVCSDHCAAPRR